MSAAPDTHAAATPKKSMLLDFDPNVMGHMDICHVRPYYHDGEPVVTFCLGESKLIINVVPGKQDLVKHMRIDPCIRDIIEMFGMGSIPLSQKLQYTSMQVDRLSGKIALTARDPTDNGSRMIAFVIDIHTLQLSDLLPTIDHEIRSLVLGDGVVYLVCEDTLCVYDICGEAVELVSEVPFCNFHYRVSDTWMQGAVVSKDPLSARGSFAGKDILLLTRPLTLSGNPSQQPTNCMVAEKASLSAAKNRSDGLLLFVRKDKVCSYYLASEISPSGCQVQSACKQRNTANKPPVAMQGEITVHRSGTTIVCRAAVLCRTPLSSTTGQTSVDAVAILARLMAAHFDAEIAAHFPLNSDSDEPESMVSYCLQDQFSTRVFCRSADLRVCCVAVLPGRLLILYMLRGSASLVCIDRTRTASQPEPLQTAAAGTLPASAPGTGHLFHSCLLRDSAEEPDYMRVVDRRLWVHFKGANHFETFKLEFL